MDKLHHTIFRARRCGHFTEYTVSSPMHRPYACCCLLPTLTLAISAFVSSTVWLLVRWAGMFDVCCVPSLTIGSFFSSSVDLHSPFSLMLRLLVRRWLPTSSLAVMTLAWRKSITRLEERSVMSSSMSSAHPLEASILLAPMHIKACLMNLFGLRFFQLSAPDRCPLPFFFSCKPSRVKLFSEQQLYMHTH